MYNIKDHSSPALPTATEIAFALKPSGCATHIYYGFWWLVLVDSINVEEKDVACKFMNPDDPTNSIC